MKRCSHCKTYKPLTEFYGVQSWCKPCKLEAMKTYRASIRPEPSARHWKPTHGEDHHLAKLTNEDIRLIRSLLPYLSCAEIGRKFEVSRQTISHIKNNRSWTQVA